MTWLTENWPLLLFGGGLVWFMARGGGMGCGMGGHGTRRDASEDGHRRDAENPDSPTDPVSHEPVPPDSSVATAYRGTVYRFVTRENRDRFEADPERFAIAGQSETPTHHHRPHGGC